MKVERRRSSAWLEQGLHKAKVTGSNPVAASRLAGRASDGFLQGVRRSRVLVDESFKGTSNERRTLRRVIANGFIGAALSTRCADFTFFPCEECRLISQYIRLRIINDSRTKHEHAASWIDFEPAPAVSRNFRVNDHRLSLLYSYSNAGIAPALTAANDQAV